MKCPVYGSLQYPTCSKADGWLSSYPCESWKHLWMQHSGHHLKEDTYTDKNQIQIILWTLQKAEQSISLCLQINLSLGHLPVSGPWLAQDLFWPRNCRHWVALKSGRAGSGVQSSSAFHHKPCSWVCVSKVTPGASRGRFHPTFKLLLLAGMGKGGDSEHHKGLYGEGKILNLENLTFNHGCSSMCVSSATLQTEILSLEVQTHRFCCLPGPFPSL